jgi:parallel beta-helix repeat protein
MIDRGPVDMKGDNLFFIGIVLILAFCLPGCVSQVSDITIVDEKGDADYSSIQEAVNAANPGDVIEVRTGVYKENVVITKDITLRGTGLPVIDAGRNGGGVVLSADGIDLEGFVVVNSSEDFGGIMILSNDTRVANNTAINNVVGIMLEDGSNNTLTENLIANNENTGLYLYFSNNNTIINNYIGFNLGDGINLWYSKDEAIEANTATNNAGNGIRFSFSTNNSVVNNDATNNSLSGIKLSNSGGNIIRRNSAGNNVLDAIITDSENNIFEDNIPDSVTVTERVIPFIRGRLTHVVVYSTPPGANIILDENKTASTPAALPFKESGEHTLVLQKPGYNDYERTFAVPETKKIEASLESP